MFHLDFGTKDYSLILLVLDFLLFSPKCFRDSCLVTKIYFFTFQFLDIKKRDRNSGEYF
jgi:hypothetical protein